ncbi:MAG: hypothetical protein C5B58_04055 [Acidobacteria bacterium]|nr:MAG: hypothetical protein C5B58_04055 [Acidobacteriota bacterium]
MHINGGGEGYSSISFVVTATDRLEHAGPNLATLRSKLRGGDEVFVFTCLEAAEGAVPSESWYSVVTVPDATVFALRARIPAVCRNEWIVLLEDHALIEPRAIDSIREVIRSNPDIDLIPFLAKNLSSKSRWGWAVFLYVFALVWTPIDEPPPFSAVTSAVVRRARLGKEVPLDEGLWELKVIPGIFSRGKTAYSNDICIDHFKPVTPLSAVILAFHNARVGAALQRKLGVPVRDIVREGWYCAAPRPQILAKALARRMHELPTGTFQRIRILGCAHLVGNVVGSFFGAGRSGHKV